jgi:hypothetical protein
MKVIAKQSRFSFFCWDLRVAEFPTLKGGFCASLAFNAFKFLYRDFIKSGTISSLIGRDSSLPFFQFILVLRYLLILLRFVFFISSKKKVIVR